MLSYYVIYYEKFKKVMQRTEKEALRLFLLCDLIHVIEEGPHSPGINAQPSVTLLSSEDSFRSCVYNLRWSLKWVNKIS